ncbi:MAG: hypothetical protein Q7V05_11630 [Methanoregula sp.]|nr:hypothetical protein [Methanoregula sp.]
MKCWRDLLHECSGNDCPMWMEEFDLTDVPNEKAMGLSGSKCALAINEKLCVFQSMLDIAESLVNPDIISDDDLFRQLAEFTLDPSRKGPARTLGTAKAVPAAKKQKKQTRA